ncbi:MAG: hypothetical protein JOZ73_01690 [Solirubrobacterales bacterium]|nr:hypothetical protein [Solirubrobacterales bacterium]
MSGQIEQFAERLIEGPELRRDFQRAPAETAERAGLVLSEDDLRALQAVDWGDDRLVAAASRRELISQCNISDVEAKENIVPVRWD